MAGKGLYGEKAVTTGLECRQLRGVRHEVIEIAPDKASALDQVVTNFHDSLTGKFSMVEFEQALTTLQRLSEKLVSTVEPHKLTQKEVWSIMRRLAGDASGIANAGF